jgi:transposase
MMCLPLYSPELNPIEKFWAIVKGKTKRNRLMREENFSNRIGDAYNNVLTVIFIAFVVTLNAKSLNATYNKHRSNMHMCLLNKCLFF